MEIAGATRHRQLLASYKESIKHQAHNFEPVWYSGQSPRVPVNRCCGCGVRIWVQALGRTGGFDPAQLAGAARPMNLQADPAGGSMLTPPSPRKRRTGRGSTRYRAMPPNAGFWLWLPAIQDGWFSGNSNHSAYPGL